MEIITKFVEDIPLLFLKGRLDALGARNLENELAPVITQKQKTLIIDFEQVDYLSSAGIRTLLSLHKRLQKEGGCLKLTSLSSLPLEVLEMAGFTNLFSIKSNPREALRDLAEITEKEKIISQWEKLPRYRRDKGIYTFLPGKDGVSRLELSGHISDILHARCHQEDLLSKSFSVNEYSLGIGALGKGTQDCLEVIGEMVGLGSIIAWLPIANPEAPDFLTLAKSQEKVDGYVLFDVALKGEFNQLVAVEAEDKNKGIQISSLYRSLFQICREHQPNFKGVLGLVMLTKVLKLYSGGIKECPISRNALPRKANSQDKRWTENLSPDKPQYDDVTALTVGVGVDLTVDLSHYDFDALDSLFYLHPLHTKNRGQLLHHHGIIFPPRDFSLKNINLREEIFQIVQQEKFLDVRHLLDTTTIRKALIGLFFIQKIERKKEKYLTIKMEGKEPPLSQRHSLITRKLFSDCGQIKLYPLGGSFSGSRVFRIISWDEQGKKQIPLVMKIGSLKDVQSEINAFEKHVKKFILNNATNLVDWIIQGDEGGLVYNFVGLAGPDDEIFSFDDFYRSHSIEEILPVLDVLFRHILKLWYRQPIYKDLALYREYNFSKKTPVIADCMRKEFSLDDSQRRMSFPELDREFLNPLYVVKYRFPERLNEELPSYQAIVHGDLNLRNILMDNKNNVWIIDFSETHQGHILKDLAKLEASVKFESFNLTGWDELEEMLEFEEAILKPEKFEEIPQITLSSKNPWLKKIYRTIQKIRQFANIVTLLEEDISQYYLALLYFTLQILRFPQLSKFNRMYALLSASLICEKLQ